MYVNINADVGLEGYGIRLIEGIILHYDLLGIAHLPTRLSLRSIYLCWPWQAYISDSHNPIL